jgi:hypothetical protein
LFIWLWACYCGHVRQEIVSSDVPARLGLKTAALAQLFQA